MTPFDNVKIASDLYRSMSPQNSATFLNALSDNVEFCDIPSGMVLKTKNEIRQYQETWFKAFPDATCEVTQVWGSGDRVLVEFTVRGTHQGPLALPSGSIGPTYKKIECRNCDILQFRDGKIISGRTYYDMASLLSQLGVGVAKLAA